MQLGWGVAIACAAGRLRPSGYSAMLLERPWRQAACTTQAGVALACSGSTTWYMPAVGSDFIPLGPAAQPLNETVQSAVAFITSRCQTSRERCARWAYLRRRHSLSAASPPSH